ncbi:MAG: cytochrome c3 family protein [Planctomycetes bacterium]|nr:cytochrome c3 family protein [Planctomycetota bacterium]
MEPRRLRCATDLTGAVSSCRGAAAIGFCTVLFLTAPRGLAAQETSSCAPCHEKERAQEEKSVHLREGVACTDCHGGDPKEIDKGRAHADRVKKVPHTEVPKLCGGCHADVRRMNPYGLPTDQLSRYQTSRHGEVLAQGDTEVATCTDCHRAHGVLSVKSPDSPVYPRNVPGTCGRCHGDEELMKKRGKKSTAPALYRQSVHAALLFDKGDLSAPTCATCHGNHGAVPPGVRDITHVCGKCHVKEHEVFERSPHFQPTRQGDFKGCVQCHTNHKILKSPADIRKKCGLCHDEDHPGPKRFDAIFARIDRGEAALRRTGERLEELTRAGFHTEDDRVLWEQAKTANRQILPGQHALDLKTVEDLASTAEKTLAEVDRSLEEKEKSKRVRRLALVPIWGFLVVMAGLFWAKRKAVEKRAGSAPSPGDRE